MAETVAVAGTITVHVDVAGFYYRGTVDKKSVVIPKGASVLDAMSKARADNIAAFRSGKQGPILDFSIEKGPSKGLFVNEISILHLQKAVSRQSRERSYPPGRYAYADDPIKLGDDPDVAGKKRLRRSDGSELPYVLAWQYYLYDSDGRDLARKPPATSRTVVAAFEQFLHENVTIVWRLIAIFLEPSEPDGIKSKKART